MNAKAIGAASQVICAAMGKNRVPATIAVALDAKGLLAGPDVAAETLSLRAQVTELQAQLATAERQNRDLDERLLERTAQLNGLLEVDEKAVPA